MFLIVPAKEFHRARDILNELIWREGRSIKRAEIWYADRMNPLGYRIINGSDVTELGRGYFSTADSMLPYYKIMKISCGDSVLFEREQNRSKTTK